MAERTGWNIWISTVGPSILLASCEILSEVIISNGWWRTIKLTYYEGPELHNIALQQKIFESKPFMGACEVIE